jgi:hypothetical protein
MMPNIHVAVSTLEILREDEAGASEAGEGAGKEDIDCLNATS